MNNYISLHHENDEKGLTSNEVKIGQEFVSKSLIKNPLLIEFINFSHHQNDKKQQAIAYQDKQRLRKFRIYNVVLVTLTIFAITFAWLAIISEQKAVASQTETKLALIESDHNYALLLKDKAEIAYVNNDIEKAKHLSLAALSKAKSVKKMSSLQDIIAKHGMKSRVDGYLFNGIEREYLSESNIFDVQHGSVATVNKLGQISVTTYDSQIRYIDPIENVVDLKFHPKHKSLILSLDKGGMFKVWGIETSKVLFEFSLKGPNYKFLFSNNGRFLATLNKENIFVWDVSKETPVLINSADNKNTFSAISDDGRRLVGVTNDNQLISYSFEETQVAKIIDLSMSLTSNILFNTNESVLFATKYKKLVMYNLTNGNLEIISSYSDNVHLLKIEVGTDNVYYLNNKENIKGINISTRKSLGSGVTIKQINDFEVCNGIVYALKENQKQLESFYFANAYSAYEKSKDEKFLAAAIGKYVKVWDLINNKQYVLNAEVSKREYLTFSEDNDLLFLDKSNSIRRWDFENNTVTQIISTISTPEKFRWHALLPSGRFYIHFGSQFIHVINLKTLDSYNQKLPEGNNNIYSYNLTRDSLISFYTTKDSKKTSYDFNLAERKLSIIAEKYFANITHSPNSELIAHTVTEEGSQYFVISDHDLKERKRLPLKSKVIYEKFEFSNDNRFLFSQNSAFKWDITANTYSNSSLGARKYITLVKHNFILGFKGPKIIKYSLNEKKNKVPSRLNLNNFIPQNIHSGITFKPSKAINDDKANMKSLQAQDVKTFETSNKNFKLIEFLPEGNQYYQPVLYNLNLKIEYKIKIDVPITSNIKQAQLSEDGLKIILLYAEGYFFYNLSNQESYFLESHPSRLKYMFGLFTNDNKYALVNRPGVTSGYGILTLEKNIDLIKHGIRFYSLGGIKLLNYHVKKEFFIFQTSRENKLFIYQPLLKQKNEIVHPYSIEHFHSSLNGDYLTIKTSSNEYKFIDLKPYLMNKEQWQDEFHKYEEKAQSYIHKSYLNLISKA